MDTQMAGNQNNAYALSQMKGSGGATQMMPLLSHMSESLMNAQERVERICNQLYETHMQHFGGPISPPQDCEVEAEPANTDQALRRRLLRLSEAISNAESLTAQLCNRL